MAGATQKYFAWRQERQAAPAPPGETAPSQEWTWDEYSPITDGTQLFKHAGIDRVLADKALALPALAERLPREVPQAPALARDLFQSFWQRLPERYTAGEVPAREDYTINGQILDELTGTEGYADMHAIAMGDQFLAGVATAGTAKSALESLDAGVRERLRRAAALAEEQERLRNQASGLEELAGRGVPGAQDALDALARRSQELADLIAAVQALSEEEREAIRRQLSVGCKAGAAQLGDVAEALNALGGGNLAYAAGWTAGAAYSGLSNEQKAKIAARVLRDQKLRKIMEMAGRMARVALQVRERKTEEPTDEFSSIKYGRDLALVLPSEYGLLTGDPDLGLLFDLRFVTETLQENEVRGREPLGRGPLIVALDNSGSMDGEPEVWSKGVLMALRLIAAQQKRDFYVLHFNSQVVREDDFPQGSADPDKMLNTLEFFSGGGTNFEPWMNRALALVQDSRWQRADVIAITDGLCAVDKETATRWNLARAEREMAAHCILIGDDAYGRQVVEGLVDSLHVISDLSMEQDAGSTALQDVFSV